MASLRFETGTLAPMREAESIQGQGSRYTRPRSRRTPVALCDHCGMAKAWRRWRFYASLPERGVRAGAAALGGTLHETFELTLPRFVRRSRFYEATAKNLLRVAVELVGGVERPSGDERGPSIRELAKRKGAGNV